MHIVMSALLAVALAGGARAPVQDHAWVKLAEEVQHYWVFCINGHTSVEMWDEDQMHVRYGSDVCKLYTNTSESSAMDWMAKNFPSGTCSC